MAPGCRFDQEAAAPPPPPPVRGTWPAPISDPRMLYDCTHAPFSPHLHCTRRPLATFSGRPLKLFAFSMAIHPPPPRAAVRCCRGAASATTPGPMRPRPVQAWPSTAACAARGGWPGQPRSDRLHSVFLAREGTCPWVRGRGGREAGRAPTRLAGGRRTTNPASARRLRRGRRPPCFIEAWGRPPLRPFSPCTINTFEAGGHRPPHRPVFQPARPARAANQTPLRAPRLRRACAGAQPGRRPQRARCLLRPLVREAAGDARAP
ncbi:MAG: hypothetical protein J3K34DRAFT_423874 [Monoraphidium minutum]|nr:MAG: hypothetical protein J3K34DRAFT_423874 [Monoraphidium minutum]